MGTEDTVQHEIELKDLTGAKHIKLAVFQKIWQMMERHHDDFEDKFWVAKNDFYSIMKGFRTSRRSIDAVMARYSDIIKVQAGRIYFNDTALVTLKDPKEIDEYRSIKKEVDRLSSRGALVSLVEKCF